MIYAKFKYIEKKICLDDKYNFIIIENINFFHKIYNDILSDIDSSVLFHNQKYEQIFLDKKIEVITDYFSIDCSKNKYLFDFLKINKFTENENVKFKLNNIYDKIDDLIEEIKFNTIIDIDYEDDLDLEYLLKSIGVRFNNSNKRIDKLINYCRLLCEVYKKEVFIFFNLNMYYSETDITYILDQLYLLGIRSINISTNDNNLIKNDFFNKIIIDNDLCEFYNKSVD